MQYRYHCELLIKSFRKEKNESYDEVKDKNPIYQHLTSLGFLMSCSFLISLESADR